MSRPPRPRGERILNRQRLLRILLGSAVMAAGTLAVLVWAPGPEPQLGVATVAGTMAFVTFVFFQAFNLLNVRHDTRSVFSRETLHNRRRSSPPAPSWSLLVLLVEMDALHGLFTTTDLTPGSGWPAQRSAPPSSSSANYSRWCCAPAAGERLRSTSHVPDEYVHIASSVRACPAPGVFHAHDAQAGKATSR